MSVTWGSREYLVLLELLKTYLRPAVSADVGSDGTASLTFVPPLTVGEQTTFGDLQLMAKFGITANLTLAEFQAIKPDLVTAKAFLGIASPTQAQSNAALKSTIRVLGALLRS